jgi:outer membrane protein TolC
MNARYLFAPLFSLLLTLAPTAPLAAPVPGGDPAATTPSASCGMMVPTSPPRVLTLRQAERIALEQNLNLKAQSYDLLAGEAAVRREYGLYDPQLGLFMLLRENQERLNSLFASDASTTEHLRFDASLSQRVPTGATAAIDFLNQRMDTTLGPVPDINPNYDSTLRLSLVQPLLKNFGRTVTEQTILFAVKDRERSVQDLRDQAFSVVGGVRDAYFEVLRSRDELAYRKPRSRSLGGC